MSVAFNSVFRRIFVLSRYTSVKVIYNFIDTKLLEYMYYECLLSSSLLSNCNRSDCELLLACELILFQGKILLLMSMLSVKNFWDHRLPVYRNAHISLHKYYQNNCTFRDYCFNVYLKHDLHLNVLVRLIKNQIPRHFGSSLNI